MKASEIIELIRKQVHEQIAAGKDPRRIYVNLASFKLIKDYLEGAGRFYDDRLGTVEMNLFGCAVKIHDDFFEPMVR